MADTTATSRLYSTGYTSLVAVCFFPTEQSNADKRRLHRERSLSHPVYPLLARAGIGIRERCLGASFIVGVCESNKNDVISISYCVIAFLGPIPDAPSRAIPSGWGGWARDYPAGLGIGHDGLC